MGISERKQRQFDHREAEIIETAMSLFRQQDIDRVTIEQIAEAAEIGKGTVYKHFKSKDELYARIIIQLNRAMRADITAIDQGLEFPARLDRIIDVIWQHDMRDSQFLHRLNLHVMSGPFRQNLEPKIQKEFDALQEEENIFYMQLLADAQQRGEIVNEPLEGLLFCAASAIDGAILNYWQLESMGVVSEKDNAELLSQLKRFIFRALGAK